MQRLLYFFLLLGLWYGQTYLNAATYYLDAISGNNNNTGTSSTSAWKTISKVNSTTLKPGDIILFNAGQKWREQITISVSGTSLSRIKFGSFGSGEKPIISGSDVITGFTQYSGNVWMKALSSPKQVFFNNIRGVKRSSVSALTTARDWYWNSNTLYVYSSGNPSSVYTSPGIEAALRNYGAYINGKYVDIENLQIEKTVYDGVVLTPNTDGNIVNNISFYQWTDEINTARAGVRMEGRNSIVRNCTFGRSTGNDLADQNWAGFLAITVWGANQLIENNKIYHNSLENESSNGYLGHGINIGAVSGLTKVGGNYIYHIASTGIIMTSNSKVGDEIRIYDNTVEYPGQAGVSLFQTRGSDGVGGKGYVYRNNISFANRLGNDVGAKGNQASGIHFNDGVQSATDPAHPYMKWYCYENEVHHNYTPKMPNTPDANGISMDFNSIGVEAFRNLVHDNAGKGLEIWNSDNCKIYYNIVYGNDAGTTVTTAGGNETTNNNAVYNNTYYKNYNGDSRGPNLNTEIYFGMGARNNTIKNNILYSSTSGYAYYYNRTGSPSGNVLDNNLVYAENGTVAYDGYNGRQTYSQWRANFPSFDVNSVNANPLFNNAAGGDFSLTSNSPAINKGAVVGLTNDFLGKILSGVPDIGALESGSETIPPPPANTGYILLNANSAVLTGNAYLGGMTGMKNTNVVYFEGTEGRATFTIKIPRSGTWYAWARMYYMSSGGKNSFYLNIKGTQFILGDNDNKYDQWHWDGYKGAKQNLGTLAAGTHYMSISGREPGFTLWIDQIVLTDNPDFVPTDAGVSKEGTEQQEYAENILPAKYDLVQNFPNPFNPSTTIRFSLPENSDVSLIVYDILGNEVDRLVSGAMPAGKHEIKFKGDNLASGIYIYRLQGNNFVKTMKMQLLK